MEKYGFLNKGRLFFFRVNSLFISRVFLVIVILFYIFMSEVGDEEVGVFLLGKWSFEILSYLLEV